MPTGAGIQRLETGLPGLDDILGGGLPVGSMTVVAGRPGAGKTILAQQVCFHNASPTSRVLYFNTLAESTAKTLRHLALFEFFDAAMLETAVQFIDLGGVARTGGLEQAAERITEHVERVRPTIVVVDGFKVFDELARSSEDLRRFGYEIAVKLMVWECTTLLLGPYRPAELASNPLFSVVDGVMQLAERRWGGPPVRVLRVVKMRGTAHSREAHRFTITKAGIDILRPPAVERAIGDLPLAARICPRCGQSRPPRAP